MKQDIGRSLTGRATRASTEPASSLGHTASVPSAVPAWHVEIYWQSIILPRLGWVRSYDRSDERTFRTLASATRYAERKTGMPSFLVPYMFRKGVVVLTTRKPDWRDKLRTMFADAA